MGFAMAMGELPVFVLELLSDTVFSAITQCCVVEEDKMKAGIFAEARRNAVNAIVKLASTLKGHFQILAPHVTDMFTSLLKSKDDYTVDNRGDVGAWVREAALSALCQLTFIVVEANPNLFTADICTKIMCFLVQQSAEKIDRTRSLAGNLLLEMIHHVPEVPNIPHRDELVSILDTSMIGTLNWASPVDGFQTIIKLLHLKEFQYSILLGLTISAGGLTESLVRASSDSLLDFLSAREENETEMDMFTGNLLLILQNYQKDDRVIIPLLKLLDILLSTGSLEVYNTPSKSCEFPLRAVTLTKAVVTRCPDVKKLLASVNVFCGFVPYSGEVHKKALFQLMMFLCHKYPRMRKATAEQLYTTLLTYEDIIPQEHYDDVTMTLVDVTWDDDVEKIRPLRNRLCDWLGIDAPKLKNKVTSQTTSTQKLDDLDSYKDLVTRQF